VIATPPPPTLIHYSIPSSLSSLSLLLDPSSLDESSSPSPLSEPDELLDELDDDSSVFSPPAIDSSSELLPSESLLESESEELESPTFWG